MNTNECLDSRSCLKHQQLSTKLHSSKRKGQRRRKGNNLSPLIATHSHSSRPGSVMHSNSLFPLLCYRDFLFLNNRCTMINESCKPFRNVVLHRLQNTTYPMRGSKAIPLGFTRSSCRIVTHVSPAWLQANILSVTRSTK